MNCILTNRNSPYICLILQVDDFGRLRNKWGQGISGSGLGKGLMCDFCEVLWTDTLRMTVKWGQDQASVYHPPSVFIHLSKNQEKNKPAWLDCTLVVRGCIYQGWVILSDCDQCRDCGGSMETAGPSSEVHGQSRGAWRMRFKGLALTTHKCWK